MGDGADLLRKVVKCKQVQLLRPQIPIKRVEHNISSLGETQSQKEASQRKDVRDQREFRRPKTAFLILKSAGIAQLAEGSACKKKRANHKKEKWGRRRREPERAALSLKQIQKELYITDT